MNQSIFEKKLPLLVSIIGVLTILYGIVNPVVLLNKWLGSQYFIVVGGLVTTIGVIFTMIDSTQKSYTPSA